VAPATTFSDAGTFTVTTDQGAVSTSNVGVLDVAQGTFSEMGRVSEGTGRFAGATGVLFFFGSATAAPDGTLHFQGDIAGELCLAP